MKRSGHFRIAGLLVALLLAVPAVAQDVVITLDQFGVGQHYRPGDPVALRVSLTSQLEEPTRIWVQVEVPNPDGDVAEYGRGLTLNLNQTQSLWLYFPVPETFPPGTVIAIRAFEERDGRRRQVLGGIRVSPGPAGSTEVEDSKSMIGIVGPSARMGLTQYQNPNAMSRQPVFANEDTRIVSGIRPNRLPDRWDGLKSYEALAWGGDFSPRDISDAQAIAIRNYVQRGGHLVISLPAQGNPWDLGGEAQSIFHDLMPTRQPRRIEEVPIGEIMEVTSKSDRPRRNFRTQVWVFRDLLGDFDAIDNHYQPLIVMRDGRVIAIRRSFGHGHITILGLDLTEQRAIAMGAIQADILWNRVLGRRVDTPTTAELQAIKQADRLTTSSASENSLGGGRLFNQIISMSEEAGLGLLTAFGLIVLYWATAGPVGFLLLKNYGLERHAWIAFAAAAGIFTGAAWGIVGLIKPSDYSIKHLTYLDLIARPEGDRGNQDPQYARAVSWFSLNMPGYQRSGVFIDSTEGQRDLLLPWAPPALPTSPFPNPDRYLVDVERYPADVKDFETRNEGLPEFKRPSRATASQFYANWLGGLDAEWGGTIRSNPENAVEVARTPTGNERLKGSIVQDLPGDLKKVLIIWIESNRLTQREYMNAPGGAEERPWVAPLSSGSMLNVGGMWARENWASGTVLDLEEEMKTERRGDASLMNAIRDYLDEYKRSGIGTLSPGSVISNKNRDDFLQMLSFFNQLEPPSYIADTPGSTNLDAVAFYRLLGRELDLSVWFTQPCLIVIGQLWDAPTPVPLRVEGEVPETDRDSLTMVRWVLPLPLDERVAFPEVFTAAAEAEALEAAGGDPAR